MRRALCSRSTWSRRPGAENYQEQSASAREAAETLVAIESADSARAAPDGPNGPNPCALSAHGARGSGCSCVLQCCAATWPYCSMRTFELLGRSWVLFLCMLWVAAGAGSVPGLSVDAPADWDVLESLHARVRARATTCHGGRAARTFCTAFVRADLRSFFELRDVLGRFGHPRHIF